MSAVAHTVGTGEQDAALRAAFLRWQCRVRQLAMRDHDGRPDDAFMPTVTPAGGSEPMGRIITVLCKLPGFSVVPEMQHMVRQTSDRAQRRKKAIQFLSATHYQKAAEFCDILTATFAPASPGAVALCRAGRCTMGFDAYGQKFQLDCRVSELAESDPLFQATWWHNLLFNPDLPGETTILGFEPDWAGSSADPAIW